MNKTQQARVVKENIQLKKEKKEIIDWLEDALSRNQIVHERDREIARSFISRFK